MKPENKSDTTKEGSKTASNVSRNETNTSSRDDKSRPKKSDSVIILINSLNDKLILINTFQSESVFIPGQINEQKNTKKM